MQHHEETLNDIDFSRTEQELAKRGYFVSDLFHMTGHLQFDLIHTEDDQPLIDKQVPYKSCGTVTVQRKRNVFYAIYSERNVCAKSRTLWGAIEQIAPKAI